MNVQCNDIAGKDNLFLLFLPFTYKWEYLIGAKKVIILVSLIIYHIHCLYTIQIMTLQEGY